MHTLRRILLRRAAPQIIATLAAMGVAIQAPPASAQPPADPAASATVRYADLDLSRAESAAVLHRRIEAAARRVCNASITYRYLRTAPERHECYRLTVDDAVRRVSLATPAMAAATPAEAAGHADSTRAIADVMAERPLAEAPGVLRAWAVEKSEDFGVVLIEVLGTIPLHIHPDGNRRMFVVEGRVRMLGGDHDMEMQPGDYMYLPREHHHKVWLAPGSQRALLLLVDNPPTSAKNIVWLDPAPDFRWNPDQVRSALHIGDRKEAAGTPRAGTAPEAKSKRD